MRPSPWHRCPTSRAARPALPRPGATLLTGLALVLGGCASVSPPRSTPPGSGAAVPVATAPAASASQSRTAGAEALAVEQRWLQDWFRGTPVRIAQRSDGTLAVEVPREFCFDAGRSQIKPALGAVLDKVAESLRRRPGTRLTLLSAPGDATASAAPATLALQRATGMQRHLRERGIAPGRLAEPAADGQAAVQLRIAAVTP
jgi:outer membrane protein OmpA-like peptidoglycan-associated protein